MMMMIVTTTTPLRRFCLPVVVVLLSMMIGLVHSQQQQQQQEPSATATAAATTTTTASGGAAAAEETRKTYVHYPKDASGILLEEVEDIGSPLGLEIVTTLAPTKIPGRSSSDVYRLLKGIVHRLRNQNQIIHANPHYYITNGLDLGCREVQIDEDTGLQNEIEVYPIPTQCLGACTNHGRYCVVETESFDPDADNHRGSLYVEETLRRMCIVEIYHGSDLKFWEYMDEFDRLDCFSAVDITECAMRAVYLVPHIEYPPLEDCMNTAGGLTNDVVNVRLKEEMEKSNGNQHYRLTDVPFIRFSGKRYSGNEIFNVPSIFGFMCSIYRQDKGVTPIACDFCGSCNNVRTCLWQLQCDGKPFVTSEFVQEYQQQEQDDGISVPPILPPPTPLAGAVPQPTFAPTAPPATASAGVGLVPSAGPTNAVVGTPESLNNSSTTAAAAAAAATVPSPLPAQEEGGGGGGSTTTTVPPPPPPPAQEEEEEEEEGPAAPVPMTNQPSSGDGETEEQQEIADDRDEKKDYHYYDSNDNEGEEQDDSPVFVAYAFLVAFGIFGIFGLATYLKKKHHERRVNSAEEYFNDLMNESYRDNMAVSGRIEDEISDRSMEDPPLDEMGGVAPPFSSFKVHMVMN